MRRLLVLVAMASVMLGATGCRLSKNFYTVESGKVYRSAQLTKAEFEASFKKLGIKTVINLRGEKPNDGWYKDEVAVTSQYGVTLVDIGMSAKRLPHREDLLKLIETLQNADYPILIHCKAGADRTGEAVAVYKLLQGQSKAEAMKSQSIKFGHIAALYPAKTYFIRELWNGLEWAYNDYNPCSGEYKYYNTNNPFCTGTKKSALGEQMPASNAIEVGEDDDT